MSWAKRGGGDSSGRRRGMGYETWRGNLERGEERLDEE